MHIGVFTYDFDPPIGGLGIHVLRLKKGMEEAQSPHSFTYVSPSPSAEKIMGPLTRGRWNKKGGSPIFSLALFFSMSNIVRSLKLDLIHAHAGSGGIVLLRKPKVPLIVTVHHTYLSETKHVFSGSLIKKMWKTFMSVLERRTYRLADLIMCVSADTKADLESSYGVPHEKIIVIENSLDDAAFVDSVNRKENELLFIGRLEPRKGIDVFLDAFELLRTEMPDVHATIIGKNLMGDGFTADMQNRFGSALSFLGHIEENVLKEHLKTATLLVVPSRTEGFGFTAAEGMAAGMCVIASDAPGLRSIIRNGETGLLFQNEDANDLKDVLVRALHDKELRRKIGEKAASEAKERFRLENQVRKTLQAYEQARK